MTTEYRKYDAAQQHVRDSYKLARQHQTVDFVKQMHTKYLQFNRQIDIWEVHQYLETMIDLSDPDTQLANGHHDLQTAESMRRDGQPDWMILAGFLHDFGKIITKWGTVTDGTSIDTQWAVVGDTYIVGCEIPDSIVYPEYNQLNPDMSKSETNSKCGIYQPNCGLDNCLISFGHDEYMYQVLINNNTTLPEEALYAIRYHSLYLHHRENAYKHLLSDKDQQLLPTLKTFNSYDLYTKHDDIPKLDKDYYTNLILKYLPSTVLRW